MKWVKKREVGGPAITSFFSDAGDVLPVEAEEMVMQTTCCHIRAAAIKSTHFLCLSEAVKSQPDWLAQRGTNNDTFCVLLCHN